MLIFTHDGQTSIQRYRRKRKACGRFWMLARRQSGDTMYSSGVEFEKLSEAKERLRKRERQSLQESIYDGIFDVLTHEMWIYVESEDRIKQIYSSESGWN